MNLSNQEMDEFQTINRDWIFTFGLDHGYGNCFIKIHGNIRTSRDTMTRLFGSRWAFQYPSEIEAGTKKWNLQELDINDLPHLRSEEKDKEENSGDEI